MPVYEYECTKCGHQMELLQRITDPPVSRCEVCSGKVKKLISHSSFHLKGSGWYVTDYASNRSSMDSKSKESGDPSKTKEAAGSPKEVKPTDSKPKKESSSSSSVKTKAKD
jgi:putative FmdB family regulatory protein